MRLNFVKKANIRSNQFGVSFDYYLRDGSKADITVWTDASLTIGVGGISSSGHFFQHRWTDISLRRSEQKNIVWRELVTNYAMIKGLQQTLGEDIYDKNITVNTENKASNYMLISMASRLYRPDLQIIINEICDLLMEFRILLWMEYFTGEMNIYADALSRFFEDPLKSKKEEYSIQIDVRAPILRVSALSAKYNFRRERVTSTGSLIVSSKSYLR